jgi:hypothetical protein
MSYPTATERHFFWRRCDIGAMPDDGHHCEGEHDQRDMTVPAMPGARLVVIEAEFVFGGFETVLDGPAMAFDRYQFFMGVFLGHHVEKKARSPLAMFRRISRPRVHFPVRVLLYSLASKQACAFGSIACRQASPCAFGKILRNLRGAPANHLLLTPGMEQMIGGNTQDITLARFAERGFEFSRAIYAVR